MGKYHCWDILGRTMCVAMACVLFAASCYALPALAAEEVTVQAANQDTHRVVSEELRIAQGVSAQETAEPFPASETAVSAESGEAEPLNALEPAAQDVDGVFAFPDDGEIYDLIIRVRRKSDILAPVVVGLQKGMDNYIPLLELSRIVKFPSEGDLQAQTVHGIFYDAENTYSLDAQNGFFTVLGQRTDIPEGSVIVRDIGQGLGDFYVRTDILNQILPLDVELDFSDLTLDINTRKKLPYELEKDRRQRQSSLEDEDEADAPDLEFIPNTYRLFAPHMFNLSEQMAVDGTNGLTSGTTVSGFGDLFGTSADYTANMYYDSGNKPELQDLRLRLTRRNFGDGALPFGLKLAQVGDVSAKPSPLIDKTVFGRGLYLSSASTTTGNQSFDEVTIQGTGQPGWEVEIYRGNELLDFGFIDERGEYRFESVPLQYGRNQMRIVLYGPQGEVIEETRDFQIKTNRLRSGETNFEAGLIDFRQPLFDVDERGPKGGQNEGLSGYLRVNRGINHWLTGFATLNRTPVDDSAETYATVGAEFNALGGLGQVEAYKQQGGGEVLDTRFTRSFAGVNTNIRASVFRDFESREAGFGDNAKTFEGEFRAAKSFNLSFGQTGINFRTRHTKREDGDSNTNTTLQNSLGVGKFNFNNSFIVAHRNNKHESTTGQFSVSTPLSDRLHMRTTLDYDVYPKNGLDFSRLNLRYTDHDKFSATLDARQGIEDSSQTNVTLGAAYDFGTFTGGIDTGWSRQDGFDMLVRASTTFGPDGEDDEYVFTSEYTGFNTALKIRLFEDLDMDGVFDPEDRPVEGGRVFVNRARSDRSDADGYIEILGAGPPGLVEIKVDQEALPNPFLAGLKDGYRTILRPRTKPLVNYALVQTGSIDGVIRFPDGRAVPGVIIQLLNENGLPVAEATTLSDGYYVFEFVKPGTYTVRAHPSHQVFVPPATVRVTSEDLFAYGTDLQLLGQTEEVSASENSDDGDRGRVAHTNHAPDADVTKQSDPLSSDDGVQPVVGAVRFGEHPYKVRLVMDLSGPAGYTLSSEDGGHIINIDLPSTAWNAPRDYNFENHPLFSGFEVLPSADGTGSRLRLTARAPVKIFYNADLPATNELPDRIYVDFIRGK